jgi:hypothetical protein
VVLPVAAAAFLEAAGVVAAAFLEAAGVAAAAGAVKATGVGAAAAASLAAVGVAPFHYPGTTVLGTYLTSNTVAGVGYLLYNNTRCHTEMSAVNFWWLWCSGTKLA